MKRAQLILAKGKEKSLERHHPWIFSGAIAKHIGKPKEGDLVDVIDGSGHWLCVGHYQNESIMVKVLSYEEREIDEVFWIKRLAVAIDYRKRLGFFDNKECNVFRLIYSEGDFLPGLVADWYNGIVVMQASSVGMYKMIPQLATLLKELMGDKLIAVFDKSAATVPGGGVENKYVLGEGPEEWEICEWGNRMLINFYEGQKTGFFVDQRDNRKLIAELSKGKRVLNTFGYTGGFSLGALRGGASYVETVDVSKKSIALCNRNVEMNFGKEAPHVGVVADVLKYLDNIKKDFDIIILDPPAFVKTHKALQHGLKGYRTINQKAIKAIKSGGLLMTFSCSQSVSKEDFQTVVFSAANLAGRKVRIVKQLPHAMDHPVSIYHPEGEYLKGLLLYVE